MDGELLLQAREFLERKCGPIDALPADVAEHIRNAKANDEGMITADLTVKHAFKWEGKLMHEGQAFSFTEGSIKTALRIAFRGMLAVPPAVVVAMHQRRLESVKSDVARANEELMAIYRRQSELHGNVLDLETDLQLYKEQLRGCDHLVRRQEAQLKNIWQRPAQRLAENLG